MNIYEERIKRIQPAITQFTGWANFENYVNNHMHDDIAEIEKLKKENEKLREYIEELENRVLQVNSKLSARK